MTIEILTIILAVFGFLLMGLVLHLARTNEQLRQYIGELERDIRLMRRQVFRDVIADNNKKGGVTDNDK